MASESYTSILRSLYFISLALFYIPCAIELWLAKFRGQTLFNKAHFIDDAGFILVRFTLLPLLAAVQFRFLEWLSQHSLYQLNLPVALRLLFGFLIADFGWYAYHWLMHRSSVLWAMHRVHHSIEHLNLLSSFRIHALAVPLSSLAFVPFILIGFKPFEILIPSMFVLAWQVMCHTQIKISFGFLEGWILSPSAHRVHHGLNDVYRDKNYGTFLMCWDRLFHTYEPESEAVRYGLETPPKHANVIYQTLIDPYVEIRRRSTKPSRFRS